MKKFLLGITAFIFLSYTATSQSTDTAEVSGTEYIPVEGKSETGVPAELQGRWILVSGVKPVKRTDTNLDFENKKVAPGTETRRDSMTTSTTVNGVTRTTTEVEIDRAGAPERQVTPPQGGKMHNPEKPGISFYGLNETFSGFTGCNKFSGRYSITGKKLSLTNATPSTKMICMGEYDEKSFLDTLKKVNSFRSNNGHLELMNGEDVLLVFERK